MIELTINLILNGVTAAAVSGIIVKNLYEARKQKKDGINGILPEIRKKINTIEKTTTQTEKDIAIIKTEITNIKEKNNHFDIEISKLTDKLFTLGKKGG